MFEDLLASLPRFPVIDFHSPIALLLLLVLPAWWWWRRRRPGGAIVYSRTSLLAKLPQLAYAGAVDNNGYFPTHNKKFSQPLTGNYDVDIVNNRTKRIFDDRTGSRCGSNTKAFLLQTYKRDTGEVMHDLSAPIYVDGKHWGGFRVGYRSSAAK